MEGPEKSLMPLAGKPLIAHACDRLQRQIGDIIINANGDPARFRFLGKPVQALPTTQSDVVSPWKRFAS